jgi:N-acetylneuraminic acid mutarotase
MKKQTNSDTKAHLPRSAFYVLLLVGVFVIPFALALSRSGGSKRSMSPGGTCPTPWQFVADMPLDLYGAASASDGTYAYFAGGYSFSFPGTVNVFNRYDPVTNTWTPLTPMPTGAAMASAVYYPQTSKIYVFGGAEFDSGTIYNLTQIYDIASNTWSSGANMPDLRSFMGAGYVPANGKIYLVSGYNTGDVTSAQPDTWEYDPAANTFTSRAPFPHPAGGFASGVINGKLYVAGGRDANNLNINLTWEYGPVADTWTAKANRPGAQPNIPGSAVALNALFAFGGGRPFLAPGSAATKASSRVSHTASGSNKLASDLTRAAFPVALGRAAVKDKALVPLTTHRTYVYDPSLDQWTRSANMNEVRSFTSGAFISGSNEIIAAGGFDGIFSTLASAETLTPCIPTPTPTPPPCPTPTPHPPCGLLIGDGLTIGFEPNGYQLIASNIVNYTFSSSISAPNDYAIFETHDPWGFTVVKDAITAAGHTYAVFTPGDLVGFDFSQYRVVILNWDDTVAGDFLCPYTTGLPALEAYTAAGGVVWVQGAIQDGCYPLPFGGQSCLDFGVEDPIVDICSPMVLGVPDPIVGDAASHVMDTDLPPGAHVVVINDNNSNPVLYDLECPTAKPTPTPTPPLCDTGLIRNDGFETGHFTGGWDIDGASPTPIVSNALSHTGTYAAFAGGNLPLQFCGFGNEPSGDSSFYQEFGPVPANATLSFWHWDCTTDAIDFDWQDAYITDSNGNILQTIFHQCGNCQSWVNQTVDLAPYEGQTIRVKFLVHQDGFGALTGMFVDDVQLTLPCGSASPTPAPRATPVPRSRPTPPPRP